MYMYLALLEGLRRLAFCPLTLTASLLISGIPSAEAVTFFYQPPQKCDSWVSVEQRPENAFRFTPNYIQDQGTTNACGYITGTNILESLIKSQNPSRGEGLSVKHCMEQLGVDDAQFEKARMNPISFLLNMRSKKAVRPFDKTVSKHHADLCQGQNGKNQTMISLEKDLASLFSTDQACIDIPPYNIETWDFSGNEIPSEISAEVFSYFQKNDSLPLAFSTCVQTLDPDFCSFPHAVTLLGVRKYICKDKITYTGIFKDSVGEQSVEYDLETILAGMIKYKYYYSTIHPCGNSKGQDCLNPPILLKNRSNTEFHLAESGNIPYLKAFMEKNQADLNRSGYAGYTPLCATAYAKSLDMAKFLIENGADVNLKDAHGFSPFETAVQAGNIPLVKLLIESGAQLNPTGTDDRSPIHYATHRGDLDLLKYLINQGANINLQDAFGISPLQLAATKGDLTMLKYLVGEGANDLPNKDGVTAFHSAAEAGHLDVVNFLLETYPDLDLNQKSIYGFSPLTSALTGKHLEVAKLLIKKGADVNSQLPSGFNPLGHAIDQRNFPLVKFFVRKGADLDLPNTFGFSPINTAVEKGDLNLVKLLVRKGANINQQDADGFSPLNSATLNGHLEIIKFLIAHGADLNLVNQSEVSPLVYAAYRGDLKAVQILAEQGAKLDLVTTTGDTALTHALSEGHLQVVQYLMSKNASPDAGNTPLLDLAENTQNLNEKAQLVELVKNYLSKYSSAENAP